MSIGIDRRARVAAELDRTIRMLGLRVDAPETAALTQGPFHRILMWVDDAQRQIIHEREIGDRLARINLEEILKAVDLLERGDLAALEDIREGIAGIEAALRQKNGEVAA